MVAARLRCRAVVDSPWSWGRVGEWPGAGLADRGRPWRTRGPLQQFARLGQRLIRRLLRLKKLLDLAVGQWRGVDMRVHADGGGSAVAVDGNGALVLPRRPGLRPGPREPGRTVPPVTPAGARGLIVP